MEEQIHEAYAQASGHIEEMIRRLDVSAVFGEPVKHGDVTLIPVATVVYGFGSGQGWGREPKEAGAEEGAPSGEPKTGEGGGVGGGGGGRARPMGFIRIDQAGPRREPLEDPAKKALAGMFFIGWVVFWVLKTVRAFAKMV